MGEDEEDFGAGDVSDNRFLRCNDTPTDDRIILEMIRGEVGRVGCLVRDFGVEIGVLMGWQVSRGEKFILYYAVQGFDNKADINLLTTLFHRWGNLLYLNLDKSIDKFVINF